VSEISVFRRKLKYMNASELRQAGEVAQTRIDFNKKLKEAIAYIANSPDRKTIKEYNKTVSNMNKDLKGWEDLLTAIRRLQ